MIPAYYGLTTLARHILDTIIVFVCLIGAIEIRSYACVSDDEFDSALKELNRTQELQDEELAENYRCSKPRFKAQSAQTERIVIATTSPPLYVQRKSFFEAMQSISDRGFVITYCSIATILAADGLLSMRMAGYLSDASLLSTGAFELISGVSLLAIPFLAFNISIPDVYAYFRVFTLKKA
jgi:hypothetical protein